MIRAILAYVLFFVFPLGGMIGVMAFSFLGRLVGIDGPGFEAIGGVTGLIGGMFTWGWIMEKLEGSSRPRRTATRPHRSHPPVQAAHKVPVSSSVSGPKPSPASTPGPLDEPPDSAGFTHPHEWIQAVRVAGFEIPDSLSGVLSLLQEDDSRDLSAALGWLQDRKMLSREGLTYHLEDSADVSVAQEVRNERQQRLPDAWCEETTDGTVVHFPEDGDFQPFYGYVYAGNTKGNLEEIGMAQGTLSFPGGTPLSLQAMRPGAYGRPFRGLPADLFDEVFCTALERCTDDDFLAFADLTGTRIINIGYVYPSGLIIGHGTSHKVSDQGMRHIAGLERLEEFSLKSYQITDQGIAVLADKPALHILRLCYASATASGLRVLPLEALTELRVEWTKTIGPDLTFLKSCTNLEHLSLRLAGVNDSQVRQVK